MRYRYGLGALVLASISCGGSPTRRVAGANGEEVSAVAVHTVPGQSVDGLVADLAGARSNACPEPSPETYILRYDASSGRIEPEAPDTYPVGGQRLVLCVDYADHRDVYRVSTVEDQLERTSEAGRAFAVGGDTVAEQVQSGLLQATAGGPERVMSACGGPELVDALMNLGSRRDTLLERIREALAKPIDERVVAALRREIRDLATPPDADPQRRRCGRPIAEQEATCSLDAYVTQYLLPIWISLVDNRVYIDEERFRTEVFQAGSPTAPPDAGVEDENIWRTRQMSVQRCAEVLRVLGDNPDAGAGGALQIPDSIRRLAGQIEDSVHRTRNLVEFAETLVDELQPPQEVFDLGTFSADRLVRIEVVRRRRTLAQADGLVSMGWRERRTVRRQEVHGLDFFRVEPGFAFSLLRRPEFQVQTNDVGDSVIALRGDELRLFSPGVFLSFYWCGQDVRVAPLNRVCQANTNAFGRHVLSKLPTLTIGIPIDDSLVRGAANFFVGGLINVFPYVSVGAGAHIGLNVPYLRDGFRVGDPLTLPGGIDVVVDERVQVGLYFSLSMSNDAFRALSGFNAQQ